MRISKSKFVKLISIKEHECKALEEYLEEKALEGWMLEDIICGFLIFKKNKPQNYPQYSDNKWQKLHISCLHIYRCILKYTMKNIFTLSIVCQIVSHGSWKNQQSLSNIFYGKKEKWHNKIQTAYKDRKSFSGRYSG